MTDDEKRRQKADLLLEHMEAAEELAHLREKAKRYGDALKSLGEWMQSVAEGRMQAPMCFGREESSRACEGSAQVDGLRKLAAELKQAEARLADLAERKEKLGLK